MAKPTISLIDRLIDTENTYRGCSPHVRKSENVGEAFITNIGIPQGDCLSPVLFTSYLTKALGIRQI
jgi:hypothetical protein